jgi:hypothetical protein
VRRLQSTGLASGVQMAQKRKEVRTAVPSLEKLIESLPSLEIEELGHITLGGWLLCHRSKQVRLVTGHLCLVFRAVDVVAIEERASPQAVPTSFAVPVSLQLRRGARLLEASPSGAFRDLLPPGRRPFAISARPRAPILPDNPVYRELEKTFLSRYGIELTSQ